MAEEEQKQPETPIEDIDDDFSDSQPIVPVVEEPKEEKKEEPEPEPEPEEEDDGEPIPDLPPIVDQAAENKDLNRFEYDSPALEKIEEARKVWLGSYKKNSRIKMIYSIIVLLFILAGWLIPSLFIKVPEVPALPLYIGLGCAGIGIIALIFLTRMSRKKNQVAINDYFKTFYTCFNEYVFEGLPVEAITGEYSDKIKTEEFEASGLFPNSASIGSRDNITFTIDGKTFAICDAAAQRDMGKGLITTFVGKFLRAENSVEVKEPLVLYFSGNDRAIPPEQLEKLTRIEKNKTYSVYGSNSDKKVLTQNLKKLLRRIKTDDLLVDVSIVIDQGRTYFYLGYEDTIMVLPNEKAFNPVYVQRYRQHFPLFLEIAKELQK